jgi:NAD(P)-dependent dehydrogenase (short-subunit alcohol dehydrogenase family)
MVTSGRLDGRIAIVSGGARGIGAAIAGRFALEGASVVITDLRDELGHETAASLANGTYVHADVTSEGDWERVVHECRAQFGPPDILVSNAFASTMCTIEDETRAGWDQTIAVTLTGAFLGMRATIPQMRERGRGVIVVISSTHGGNVAIPVQAAYQAAKAGLTALARNAAVTYARDNIRANAIHPGPIRTPLVEDLGMVDEQQRIAQALPLGRVAMPAEVASAALYLASDEAAYVTGTALVIDGGYTAL